MFFAGLPPRLGKGSSLTNSKLSKFYWRGKHTLTRRTGDFEELKYKTWVLFAWEQDKAEDSQRPLICLCCYCVVVDNLKHFWITLHSWYLLDNFLEIKTNLGSNKFCCSNHCLNLGIKKKVGTFKRGLLNNVNNFLPFPLSWVALLFQSRWSLLFVHLFQSEQCFQADEHSAHETKDLLIQAYLQVKMYNGLPVQIVQAFANL